MAITFNKKLAEGFTYVIEDEKGEKKPFSVIINPIDSVRLVTLEDGLLKRSQDNSLSIATGSYNVSMCRNAITGWQNLTDPDGKEINITLDTKGYISLESLEMLPTSAINEIAGVIVSVSQDPKNIQLFSDNDK